MVDQSKESFKNWLRALPDTETAIAGDPCHCWLARWFEEYHNVFVWGVFPGSAPYSDGGVLLLDDPYEDEFTSGDCIDLNDWAIDFGLEIDRLYHNHFECSQVTRNQALAVLAGVLSDA